MRDDSCRPRTDTRHDYRRNVTDRRANRERWNTRAGIAYSNRGMPLRTLFKGRRQSLDTEGKELYASAIMPDFVAVRIRERSQNNGDADGHDYSR